MRFGTIEPNAKPLATLVHSTAGSRGVSRSPDYLRFAFSSRRARAAEYDGADFKAAS
jgi:hypothetical protein